MRFGCEKDFEKWFFFLWYKEGYSEEEMVNYGMESIIRII